MNKYLEFNNSSLVVIHITVIRCREYSDYNWEFCRAIPLMHLITIKLGFMCSQYR